jgi:DNA gyrase/topoisomerase IV subunit A
MSEVVNDIVERIWTSFVVMRTNVTERQLTEQAKLSGSIGLDVTFSRMTVPDIINNWAKYRLQLEQTMAKLEIADLQSHNKRLTLTMLAFKYFDIVRDCLTKTDSEQYLATNLSKASGQVVTVEDATYILDKQLKALKRVNLAACKEKVAENTSNIKRLTGVIKSPAASCIDALRLLTKASV